MKYGGVDASMLIADELGSYDGTSSKKKNFIDNVGFCLLEREYQYIPDEACCETEFEGDPQCKTDHSERSNPKLKSQPFYHRSNNGKMKRY
jgi:hypothetical protein